jgi:hypothetical protein
MPNILRTIFCLKFGSHLWGKRSTSGLWARPGYAFEFVRHPFGLSLAILMLPFVSAALDPTAHVCLLTSDTEVIVTPKSRKKSDTISTEVDKPEAIAPLTCVVRVLPTRLFPQSQRMPDDPTVFVSTATMDKFATQGLKEVYVTCISIPFKPLLESLKHGTQSASTPAKDIALKNLREAAEIAPPTREKEGKSDPVAVLPFSALHPDTALATNLPQVHDWGFIKSVRPIIHLNCIDDIRHRLSSTPPDTKSASSNDKHPDDTIPFLL